MAKGKQRTSSETSSMGPSSDKNLKKGKKNNKNTNHETQKSKHAKRRESVQTSAEMSNRSPKVSEQNGDSFNSELEMLRKLKLEERKERDTIVLWRRPLTTLQFFIFELALEVKEYTIKLWQYKLSVLAGLAILVAGVVAYHFPGAHQSYVQSLEKQIIWCLYWLGLGVLSSVGLGTGLHTFLLYLGPHIAAVTLAAYECGTLDFPSPPYPDSIVCPDDETQNRAAITIWSIMSKVRLEAMMWGAGTALGELPPYFMAKAARLSALGGGGRKGRRRSSIELAEAEDLEKIAEFEELQRKQEHPEELTWLDRAKVTVERLVERVGFFGILACASIPNPLFDLAGITCGHFLVPFWTFFGATLIGKAIIKTHLQQLTVIVAFNENLVESAVAALAKVPGLGPRLTQPVEQLLQSQKAKLHSKGGKQPAEGGSLLASLFEKLVLIMVAYFVLSIVNSLAQSYHRRLYKQKQMEKLMSQSPQSGGVTSRNARRRSHAHHSTGKAK